MSLLIGRFCKCNRNIKWIVLDKFEGTRGTQYVLLNSKSYHTRIDQLDLLNNYTFTPPLTDLLDE